jgi:hypothetical protein
MRTLVFRIAAPAILTIAMLSAMAAQAPPASSSTFTPAIADRADVKVALGYIDQHFDAQVAEWIHLTEIPALSTHEQQRAAYISGELKKLGLNPTIDPIGNVSARRKGSGGGPTVLFSAHMDTVHPMDTDVKVKRLPDGTLHAPGVFDDTPSDINLLQTLRALDAAKIVTKGDIIALFSVQEELGLKGMYYWFDHNPKAADMIVGIDGELGMVNYAALGNHRSGAGDLQRRHDGRRHGRQRDLARVVVHGRSPHDRSGSAQDLRQQHRLEVRRGGAESARDVHPGVHSEVGSRRPPRAAREEP